MNTELFADLVWKSQSGDADALEQLLLQAYTPVSYLTAKILQDEQTADQVTREVLEIISSRLNSLTDPDQFEKWMCRITAARCIQAMPLFRHSVAEDILWQDDLEDGAELTEEQSAQVIQSMVDSLPQKQRLCILLLCCGGLTVPAIAQLTGFSHDSVTEYITKGQNTIQQYLWNLSERNIQFSGMSSLTGILRIAMYHKTEDEDPIPLVYGILGKEIPVPPDPEKRIIRILSVVLVLLVIAILIAGGILVMQMLPRETPAPTTIPTTLPTTAATEEPTSPTQQETTAVTEEPTTETTAETIAETTVETTAETTAPAATAAPVSSGTAAPAGTVSGNSGGIPSGVPSDAPKTGEDGHTHRYLNTRTNFNCETGGIRHYLCHDCDYYYTVDLEPSGTHNFIVVPAGMPGTGATCTSPGKAYKLCNKCNYAVTVDDPVNKPPLGHEYSSSVVAPTATAQGYTLHSCSRCGDSYKDNYVDPVPAQTEAPAPSTEAPAPSTEAPAPSDSASEASETP